MAGNYISVGSKFQPFSYDQMLKPVQSASTAHQQLEEQYGNLGTQAATVEDMTLGDDYAAGKYKGYQDALRQSADDLMIQGLTPASKRNLMNMNKQYAQEIIPIKTAYTKRAEDIKTQQGLRAKDDTLIFNRTAADSSLEHYMKNPATSYESISGAGVTKRIADAVGNLKVKLRSDRPQDWHETAQGKFLEKIDQYGLTDDDFDKIMNGTSEFPELTTLIHNVIRDTGVHNWDNREQATQQLINYSREALFAGLGVDKSQIRANPGYIKPKAVTKTEGLRSVQVIPIGTKSSDFKDIDVSKLKYNKEFDMLTTPETAELMTQESELKAKAYGDISDEDQSDEPITEESGLNSYTIDSINKLKKERKELRTKSMDASYKDGLKLSNKIDEITFRIDAARRPDPMGGDISAAPARRQLKAIRKKLTEIGSRMKDIGKEYSYMGADKAKGIQIGAQIEKNASLKSKEVLLMDFGKDEKTNTHIVSGVINQLAVMGNTGMDAEGMIELDENFEQIGKTDSDDAIEAISYEDTNGNMIPKKQSSIVVDPTQGIVLISGYGDNQKRFLLQSNKSYKQMNKNIKDTYSYLQNYKRSAVGEVKDPPKQITALLGNYTRGIDKRNPNLINYVNKEGSPISKGSRYKGITIKHPNGDIIKLVMAADAGRKPEVLISTGSDKRFNGGALANENIVRHAAARLQEMYVTSQQK